MIAGIVALLAALLTLLSIAVTGFAMTLVTGAGGVPEFPPAAKHFLFAGLAFMACLSFYGVAIGVGVCRLKNWARLSLLAWAVCSIFFGGVGVLTGLFLPLPPQPEFSNLPGGGVLLVRLFLLFFYGVPLGVGIWWIVLFTRKSARALFSRTGQPEYLAEPPPSAASGAAPPPHPQKSRCPIAVAVIAWIFIGSAANVLLLPFLPYRFPLLLFGREISGVPGTTGLLVFCAATVAAGVGLLKLKPWSYTFTIALQLLGVISGLVTLLSPNYDALMLSLISKMQSAMGLPPNYDPFGFSHFARFFGALGLSFPIIILILLFYYRRRFLEAAAAAKT
jgi:hypothetical protein